ncbi:sugar transferase [Companilactobacillus nodensis]|uniref:Priming glycosyltransferase n=1 Tax=Companilactobacillus nodensis DSM 19682 = JCM 14932 = NBRC 107160 TaxID=1423775 RepID=A0A0R1K5X3_9LACO|nr:sugar transferase [Companilactobacillus nodensis]KRK79023.1 priming glycosyltransferase [Companilactobacillus nodensis DSM 19682 = JCM 14932 = NBRC 107160]
MEYWDGRVDTKYQQRRYVYRSVKRIFDFVASLIGLVLLSPLFLIVAIAIKIEDPRGPVFYTQTRLGKRQEPFEMYKFRSMVVNAEKLKQKLLDKNEIEGAMFKMKNDPRVTKVGRFIRKYSIDELPQLMNVLTGEMSLVGPRPPLPDEVKKYSSYDKQRLTVKPGCTGLWQISGRNDVGFEEMVRLDLDYINHRSASYDVYILFRTVGVFLFPNGAY